MEEPKDEPPRDEKDKGPGLVDDAIDFEAEKKEREDSSNPEPLEQRFKQDNMPLAQELKQAANDLFKQQQFLEAISNYRSALSYVPESESQLRAILYSNIAVSLSKQFAFQQAAKYCQKAVDLDPNYLKAQTNLAIYHQKAGNLEQALEQTKKLQQLNPQDIRLALKVKQLEKGVEEKIERQKKEVLDGLKNIGNSVLGYFGMSLDNFKLQQGANGGYSVSFKQ